MITTIECQGFPVTDAIDGQARAEMDDALRHCTDEIRRLDLFVRELGGRDGLQEFRIVVDILLHDLPSVRVEGSGCDLYVTMRYVAGRAERAVGRAMMSGSRNGLQAPSTQQKRISLGHPLNAAKA